jgi:hypothetical protein
MLLAFFAIMVAPGAAVAQAGTTESQPRPALNVVVIGDFYSYGYASSADPALRSSAPPTLQALNQIQAANQGVRVNVMFLPSLTPLRPGLSRGEPGHRFAAPPQINAVKSANVVIVGVGAGDARLAAWMRTVLFGATPAKAFARHMALFGSGSYLIAQIALLDGIAARVAPGASIVTVGYPTVSPEELSSGLAWWSPFSWTAISQQRANAANQLVTGLNTANDEATRIVAAQHSGLQFLYADLSGALQGKGPFSPQYRQNTAITPHTRSRGKWSKTDSYRQLSAAVCRER